MRKLTIALIGTGEFFTGRLPEILDRGGFDVRSIEGDPPPSETFDLAVIKSELASKWGEEAFFNFVLALGGFLLADDGPGAPPSRLQTRMSTEEILLMVGNAVHRSRTLNGLPYRASNRIMVSVPVMYEAGGQRHKSTITTLSSNGVFISTLAPEPVGTPLALSFTVPLTSITVNATGKVIYIVEHDLQNGIIHRQDDGRPLDAMPGMAVLLEGVAAEPRAALEEFIVRGCI